MDTDVERAELRLTLTRRIVPTLQVGVEYNPLVTEVAPLVTWFVLAEKGVRPTVFFGTSADRIGSPEGTHTYYATASHNVGNLPASVYGTLGYSTWDDAWKVPFGGYIEVVPGITIQPMYDGERTHLLANYAHERWSASLLWVWLESAGVSVAFGW